MTAMFIRTDQMMIRERLVELKFLYSQCLLVIKEPSAK